MLHCLRWCDWSDTRWLRSGKCARWYIRSLLVGTDILVARVLADPHCYHMWLRGHEKSTFIVRRFFVVAAVCSLVVEAVHSKIMADDRFLKFGEEYRSEVPRQLQAISDMPLLVWHRLCSVVKGSCKWYELRSWCQSAACTSAAFLEREVFAELGSEPFSLTQGCVEANLRSLRARDLGDVVDETSLKIRKLLAMGYDETRIIRALELLRESACTVNTSEQSHGSGAVLSKYHEYSAATLVHRAGLHKLRSLFLPDQHERAVRVLLAKVSRLDALRPERVTGRHLYFQSLAKDAAVGVDKADLYSCMQGAMQQHGADYVACDAMHKVVYEALAR